ncbi:MAG: ATP-binding protein [Cyclobacteriaceae bacterium]|nr:ATP-binding protein [Cyclobacteriaceae bacterium]UYN87061.1 MAG: ATP-binding protein [Cyclobacteriaceae bacterium]
MVLKSELEIAYRLQQDFIKPVKSFIRRDYPAPARSNHVEVISGIRRCGKSTLMDQIKQGYGDAAGYFNFEDPRVHDFGVSDFQKLDEVIGTETKAYFFDEIQNVPSWEIYVRQLHDRGKKVFITGSNASLLSKELGTRLTGRHLRHELFPFSYPEYLQYTRSKNSTLAFEDYLQHGGFPEYLRDRNEEMLQMLLKDIVARDIAIRYGIKNTRTLMDITLYLLSNVGKEFTFNSLRKSFQVGSANTVSDYLSWLEDTYLLFFLTRFSWSAKSRAVNPRKVYAIDTGMINANSLSFSKDKGRLLENIVYLHLRKRNYELSYFREQTECDFVVFEKGKCKTVMQVCQQLHNENQDRETGGLLEAMDFFGLKSGLIITQGQADALRVDRKTIELKPAHQFLMEDNF